jgi:hypothetical protein
MTKNNNIAREKRKQRRLESFGTQTPRCAVCGNSDWECLELHHVAGREYDHRTVILCANHHKLVSQDQQDHPSHDPLCDPLLERIGRFLLGLADLLGIAVEALTAFGRELVARASFPISNFGGQL